MADYKKCMDCKYMSDIKHMTGYECIHPTKKFRTKVAHIKSKHTKACLMFEDKEVENEKDTDTVHESI